MCNAFTNTTVQTHMRKNTSEIQRENLNEDFGNKRIRTNDAITEINRTNPAQIRPSDCDSVTSVIIRTFGVASALEIARLTIPD